MAESEELESVERSAAFRLPGIPLGDPLGDPLADPLAPLLVLVLVISIAPVVFVKNPGPVSI